MLASLAVSTNGQLPKASEIRDWIAGLDHRDAEIQSQIEPFLREQTANRERRRLLSELLASLGEAPPDSPSPEGPLVGGSTRDRVRAQVRLVLEDAGALMHINAIHAEFVRRGFEIPGQGRPANITAHLGGDGDIVSPQRGVYGLESVVGPVAAKPVRRRRKATTRRKVSKR